MEKKIPPKVGYERGIGFPYLLQTIPFSVTCLVPVIPNPSLGLMRGSQVGSPMKGRGSWERAKLGELASWDIYPL